MKSSVKTVTRGIEAQLEGMIKRANLIPGYLNRVVYKEYQKAQRMRWMSENDGVDFEGGAWARLDPTYAAYKLKRWKSAPGGGSKVLIASGRLFQGVIGPSVDHRKLVDRKSIRISNTVPYAKWVDEVRTFTKFSPVFYSRIYKGLRDYLTRSIVKDL